MRFSVIGPAAVLVFFLTRAGAVAGCAGLLALALACPAPLADSGQGDELHYPSPSPEVSPIPGVSAAPSPDGGTAGLGAPTDVRASYQSDGSVSVTWSGVERATGYDIYRQVSDAEWLLLASGVNGAVYRDGSYAVLGPETLVRYMVAARLGELGFSPSVPGNRTSALVTGVESSIFSSAGKNRLNWDAHGEADAYRVYRYPANAPESLQVVAELGKSDAHGAATFFEDSPTGTGGAAPDKFYFYLVSWMKDGLEFGKTGAAYRAAIFSAKTDLYEPNDSWSDLSGQTDASVFDPAYPPLVYSFSDTQGRTLRDVDWYKCKLIKGGALVVNVRIPDDSPFGNDELEFAWFCQGKSFPKSPLRRGTNSFLFDAGDIGGGASGEETAVYFAIAPAVSLIKTASSPYSVSIADGF